MTNPLAAEESNRDTRQWPNAKQRSSNETPPITHARRGNHARVLLNRPECPTKSYPRTNVTAVKDSGVTISLPGYPYSMPSQRATLQTDLRNAGKSGAVVRLFGDTWTLFLPDRPATGNVRDFTITFTPADPFPLWDFYGNYQGENQDNTVTGTSANNDVGFSVYFPLYAVDFVKWLSAGNTTAGRITQTSAWPMAVNLKKSTGVDPVNPAAGTCTYFSRLNGSSKMEFCVIFPSGAVQVIATEP